MVHPIVYSTGSLANRSQAVGCLEGTAIPLTVRYPVVTLRRGCSSPRSMSDSHAVGGRERQVSSLHLKVGNLWQLTTDHRPLTTELVETPGIEPGSRSHHTTGNYVRSPRFVQPSRRPWTGFPRRSVCTLFVRLLTPLAERASHPMTPDSRSRGLEPGTDGNSPPTRRAATQRCRWRLRFAQRIYEVSDTLGTHP